MRQIARYTGAIQLQMAWEATHMKKEAVSMSPTETMTTASVGYHSTGTGLEIAFAACDTQRHNPPRVSTLGSQAEPQIQASVGSGGLTIPSDLPPAAVVAAAALHTTSSLRWRGEIPICD